MASSSKFHPLKKESLLAPSGKSGDVSMIAAVPETTIITVLPGVLTPPMEESALSKSSHLTRPEILRRRLNRVNKLSKIYRDHYWGLMEEVKAMHREYYWKYGISPWKEDEILAMVGLGFEEGDGIGLELKYEGNNRCTFVGCKLKAMALTAFCHLHILSDPQQKLYKSCNHVIKSAQAGPILCGKRISISMVPSLCNVHLERVEKNISRALKKAGLNTSSSKVAPKFHVIVAEYVRQIKAKRREFKKPTASNIVIKDECST